MKLILMYVLGFPWEVASSGFGFRSSFEAKPREMKAQSGCARGCLALGDRGVCVQGAPSHCPTPCGLRLVNMRGKQGQVARPGNFSFPPVSPLGWFLVKQEPKCF